VAHGGEFNRTRVWRYWSKADKAEIWAGMVCPLKAQSGLGAVSAWLLKVHAPFWSKSFCYLRRAVDFARISHALHQWLFAPAWV